jgi:hypothetical protein
VKTFQRHPTPNGLGSDRFIAAGRELLPEAEGLELSLALIERRTDAGADLSFLFCPSHRFPERDQIAERLDPLV